MIVIQKINFLEAWFIFGAILACTSAKAVSRRKKNGLYQTTKGMNQFAVELYKVGTLLTRLTKNMIIFTPI